MVRGNFASKLTKSDNDNTRDIMKFSSKVRRFCVDKLNKERGYRFVKNDSGHVVIAQSIVNLGWVNSTGKTITKKAARSVMLRCYLNFKGDDYIPSGLKKLHRKKSKAFLSSWEWRTLRYKILQKYGRRCMCCGASPDDGETVIHVDHIKPRSSHPDLALDEENLQILCGVCNQGKGAWDETDFRGKQEEFNKEAGNVFQIELAREASERQ